MKEMEKIAVTRSIQELGWVAEKTPSGIPTSTASPRATHARIRVCGSADPIDRLIGCPLKTSLPKLPCSIFHTNRPT